MVRIGTLNIQTFFARYGTDRAGNDLSMVGFGLGCGTTAAVVVVCVVCLGAQSEPKSFRFSILFLNYKTQRSRVNGNPERFLFCFIENLRGPVVYSEYVVSVRFLWPCAHDHAWSSFGSLCNCHGIGLSGMIWTGAILYGTGQDRNIFT